MLIMQVLLWRPLEGAAVSLRVQEHTWHANVSGGTALTTALPLPPPCLTPPQTSNYPPNKPPTLLTQLMRKRNDIFLPDSAF